MLPGGLKFLIERLDVSPHEKRVHKSFVRLLSKAIVRDLQGLRRRYPSHRAKLLPLLLHIQEINK